MKVDFYILENAPAVNGRQLFACRLCEKVFRNGLQIFLHTDNHEETVLMDELLWTFRAGSFIPHDTREAEHTPVLVSHRDDFNDHREVLVNLCRQIPIFADQFERVLEVVNSRQDQARDQARQRYREYKKRGYQIQTHQLQF